MPSTVVGRYDKGKGKGKGKGNVMKFLRFGTPGSEKPALIDTDGTLRDLSGEITDLSGAMLDPMKLTELAKLDTNLLPAVSGNPRLGPPVAGTGKFICIGLNYSDHAAETGAIVPPEPIIFMKATYAICGPNDAVHIPRGSTKTDWEVELGVVIGRTAKYVTEAEAPGYVAGYCTVHDVSERAFQIEHEGQWTKGKSADTFGPIGPWLVTPDDVPNPQNLPMWLTVNGKKMQDGSTNTMIYSVAFLVSYLSRFMSLQPGDIISTGTPPGVGMGMSPPRYLAPGDKVELEVEGLGRQQQTITQD